MPKTIVSLSKPLIPRKRVMVAVALEHAYELRLARDYGVGVEVQTFGFPQYLAKDTSKLLQQMSAKTAELKGPIGLHGPFIDTIHHSPDPEIREVCRIRYLRAFDMAEAIGAQYVLFHSQFNPVIRVPVYKKSYHDESLRFWPELVEEAELRRMPIYIENMFEDDPVPARKVADAIDSPYFKLCLDVAHAAIHSSLDIKEWIDTCGEHLRHVHVNDCMGKMDDHLGLGQGVLDLPRAFALLKKTGLQLNYVLETHKNTIASMRYLGIDKAGPRGA
ncbi:MAG: sugar phosphate isomerase/epimerase family protein [Candidatus Hydrogenedentes bacterium]|nr:sugar phosphate isomerase/epimerase family protein [Candidatus Hydrogenedentota bacterium]